MKISYCRAFVSINVIMRQHCSFAGRLLWRRVLIFLLCAALVVCLTVCFVAWWRKNRFLDNHTSWFSLLKKKKSISSKDEDIFNESVSREITWDSINSWMVYTEIIDKLLCSLSKFKRVLPVHERFLFVFSPAVAVCEVWVMGYQVIRSDVQEDAGGGRFRRWLSDRTGFLD